MRRFFVFWCDCARIAARGGSSWQWLVGIPIVAAVASYLAAKWTADVTVFGNVITDGLAAAFATLIITWAARFLVRLTNAPVTLYYGVDARAETAEQQLAEHFSPKIRIFLDSTTKGVMELPTEIQGPGLLRQRGPSSKWVQFDVACAANAPLTACEAWLVSVERLDGPDAGYQLVEERVRCGWSQLSAQEITIRPLLTQRANLFSLYENQPGIKLEAIPARVRLTNEIQKPGRYMIRVLVTAQGAPSEPAWFIFEWRDFANVTLTQE
jgi:hypothetical protein